MWFGTLDGLNRFDGYNFKVFQTNYDDTNSIRGGRINSIIENKDGMLWVGTNEALNCYDFKTGLFQHNVEIIKTDAIINCTTIKELRNNNPPREPIPAVPLSIFTGLYAEIINAG